MKSIEITKDMAVMGATLLPNDTVLFPATAGGIDLPQIVNSQAKYLIMNMEVLEEHSATFDLMFYKGQDTEQTINIRFGLMPKIKALISIDLSWIDAGTLFPGNTPGQLKVVCHGSRLERPELGRVILKNHPCFHDLKVRITDVRLADQEPTEFPVPDVKCIDAFGQYKGKEWAGKIQNEQALKAAMEKAVVFSDGFESGFTPYGGYEAQRLGEGTGFFRAIKKADRWSIADPTGCAFFSMGPDCVRPFADCRVTGVEKLCDWLPDSQDPDYQEFFSEHKHSSKSGHRQVGKMPSFHMLNFHRVFGKDWLNNWTRFVKGAVQKNGMNTLGNWSDERILGGLKIPYVTSLKEFPATDTLIFRDFPDVLSPQYAQNAKACAQSLQERRDDPYMIGYFLRNEPAWAFVDHLILADEVLHCPTNTVCKQALLAQLQKTYGDIGGLNQAWGTSFAAFTDLNSPIPKASSFSKAALADMRAFSRKLLTAYVEIPAKACRAVDPNHMILGMRWAWISDPDIVSGWENFDVFSINCYAMDPTDALDNVVNLGVDLPIVIGEFHFGALDEGLTATGLKAVRTQEERGMAYRFYCERVAAHKNGVGCHYFQFYDQFALGRFDGENYNIGLYDICSQPHTAMMNHVKACGTSVYKVIAGEPPFAQEVENIPMIAY